MATTAPGALAPPRLRERRQPGLTDALLFLMALIWAVNYSVLKYGTSQVPPLAYNGVRIPLAALLQFGVARAMHLERVARADAGRLVMLGMLGNGLYQVMFIIGVARTRVATTVLVLASGPALAAIIGRLRGSERLSARAWSGVGLQLFGVLCVVLGTAGRTGGSDSLLGGLLVLGSAMSWAWFSVLVQPYTERLAGLYVGAWTMLGGALVSLAVGLPLMPDVAWRALEPGVWGAIGYSTVCAMVIAYLFWYHGVRTFGPTRTSMYANLQPPLAMIVAWVWLREVPTAWQIAGAICITSGLVIARVAGNEPEAP